MKNNLEMADNTNVALPYMASTINNSEKTTKLWKMELKLKQNILK